MPYRYDTAHLTGQQRAIINQRDERARLLKKSREEATEKFSAIEQIIFHEKDFQELKEMVEREQNIKLILKENHEDYFILNEQNLKNNSRSAEGTVDIVFRFKDKKLILSNFYLRITSIGTGSHIIKWFIEFCNRNKLESFMITMVGKDKIAMNKTCTKFNFKRIDSTENYNDYILIP